MKKLLLVTLALMACGDPTAPTMDEPWLGTYVAATETLDATLTLRNDFTCDWRATTNFTDDINRTYQTAECTYFRPEEATCFLVRECLAFKMAVALETELEGQEPRKFNIHVAFFPPDTMFFGTAVTFSHFYGRQ